MGYSLFLLEIYLLFSFVYWFNDSSGRRYVLLNFNLIIFFLGELIVRGIFWPSLLYGFMYYGGSGGLQVGQHQPRSP